MNNKYVMSKIVCTIGPSSNTPEIMKDMINSGMDLARLNLSHGTFNEHRKTINTLKKIGEASVLIDLPGPKIRIGEVAGRVFLKTGDKIHFTTKDITGNNEELPIIYKNLPREVQKGGNLYLKDGLIGVEIISIDDDFKGFYGKVLSEGEITSHQGLNLPGATLSLRSPTKSDIDGIKFGVNEHIDWFALSFIRDRRDVENARKVIEQAGGDQPIISKIEHRDAIDNIDEIIEASDGIMVARGDLGIEIPPWEVPTLQKSIILKCNSAGKPVIVATQMLDSMVSNPRPTRAEASDVANAILDGADAVMLSDETAVGRYPIEAVKVMNNICFEAEQNLPKFEIDLPERDLPIPDLIGSLASRATDVIKPAAIIVITRSGFTARMTSKHRPKTRILAVTRTSKIRRRMRLYWGVEPLDVIRTRDRDKILFRAISNSIDMGFLDRTDTVMIISGHLSTFEIKRVKDVLWNR
jgi:pyruvate kinase